MIGLHPDRRAGAQYEGGFRLVAFEPWHLKAIDVQAAQRDLRPFLDSGYAELLAERSLTFTAMDTEVIGCAGVIPVWPGRECVWAVLSECGPARFLRIHRAVCRFLNARETRRIEMTVDATHWSGQRWARLLGFEEEGYMKAYSPGGRDSILYARIRDVV